MTARTSDIVSSLAVLLCVALWAPHESAAADSKDAAKSDEKPQATDSDSDSKARVPKFLQRNLGSPKTRLGGATRGADDDIPRTEALVPEEAGQTLRAQPVLYWHLSKQTNHRIDFTLIGVDPINPLLEVTLEGEFEPGIQQIRLDEYGVMLQEGVRYQWFVALVPQPKQRLHDRIIGGGIERLSAPADLQSKLDAAPAADAHFILAEAGVWYDALDSLSQQIMLSPGDAKLAAQRAALLDQVGLGQLN
jgi:hypothetical protein